MSQEKIDRFRKMVEANPDNELARYSLGAALFESGQHDEAEKHLAAALVLKPDWVMAYILRSRCLMQLQRLDEVRALLEAGRAHSIEQGHEGPVEEIDDLLEMLPG